MIDISKVDFNVKAEILARFFYYIEQVRDIPFSEINDDERSFCYYVAYSYMTTHIKADELLQTLIDENDEDYIKSIIDYMHTGL
ncbi:hypothetical protein ACM3VB_005160 [Escherichia coli]|nr:hypothetical protein [Salmonella enterica subsp. enterica]EIO9288307.1 hypothetical protein [Salmonella enterica]